MFKINKNEKFCANSQFAVDTEVFLFFFITKVIYRALYKKNALSLKLCC